MNKYCRICWNILNWKKPAGVARDVEKGSSYVAEHGFGHEEWLFNFEWILKGFDKQDPMAYRYGFLQPIGKYYETYKGQSFSTLLYTITPQRQYLLIAEIQNIYVPMLDELSWVLDKMESNSWLQTMRDDLNELNLDSKPLLAPKPFHIANVKFKQSDVKIFDPYPEVIGAHKMKRINRYQPLNWEGDITDIKMDVGYKDVDEDLMEDPTYSEEQRHRSAVEGTTYNPRHVQLQNRLYHKFKSKYGAQNVHYEQNNVDMLLEVNDSIIFIEIKMELTVKRCIRLALGQLLEYSHYPDKSVADKMLVVGDAISQESDINYLSFLRDEYNIPVFYSRWDWENNTLTEEV